MKRIFVLASLLAAAMPVAAQDAQPAAMSEAQTQQMAEALRARLMGAQGDAAGNAESPMEMGQAMVRQITARQREVHELSWPLLVAGASGELCDAAGKTGILVATVMAGEGASAAWVDAVASGSPAALAGVREGDAITSINGKRVKDNRRGAEQLEDAAEDGEPVAVEVRRGGDAIALTVQPVQACALTVSMFEQAGGMFDTGTQGEIQISSALWREAQDDTERLIIIAHELAHHTGGHVATRSRLQRAGRLLDGAAGFLGVPTFGALTTAGSVATKGGDEKEADAISLKLLAHVGITPAQALAFWSRAQDEQGHRFQLLTSSHPLTDGRIEALQAAAAAPVPAGGAVAQDADL